MALRFPGKRVCVFDFDGTLVDSMPAFAELAAELLRAYGLTREEGRRRYLDTSGWPFRTQMEALFPGHPANAATVAAFEARKQAGLFARPFFPEVPEVVARLGACGIKAVIASNNAESTLHRFAADKGVPFDAVLGFTAGLKDREAHISDVMRSEGITPAEVLFVGDTLNDAALAHARDIDFVARLGTFSEADFRARAEPVFLIHNLLELPPLLGA